MRSHYRATSRRSPEEPLQGRREHPLKVLVVEDAADTRLMYERYFEFRGARASGAPDGIDALRSIESDRPDVVVLDLAMPRVTGWDVIRDLRANARGRNIPIVVVSGQHAQKSALAAGANSYIEKPCLPEDVFAEVVRLVRGRTYTTSH
jgi:chemosensory pili system protein ChpA (sensor histidine kinase/response regulator)